MNPTPICEGLLSPASAEATFMGVALFGSSSMQWSRLRALQSLTPRLKLPRTMIWGKLLNSPEPLFPLYQVGITAMLGGQNGSPGSGWLGV